VTTTPQRQTLAAAVDLEDLADLYETRRLFEGELSRRAAERRSEADLRVARQALKELKAVAGDQRSPEFWINHQTFHLALLAPAVNPWSRRLLQQGWQGSERYVRLYAVSFGSVSAAMRDHESLLEAFAEGDGELAANRLAEHLSHTEDAVRKGYEALGGAHDDSDGAGSLNRGSD
jgi:DNA-binding GntR family transcriptional regulator